MPVPTMESPTTDVQDASKPARTARRAAAPIAHDSPAPAVSEALPTPEPREERDSGELESGKRRMPENLRRFLIRVQGGKFYLPAAFRIVWFRDECPDWGVETQLLEGGQEAGFATVQARIYNAEGRLIASGIKTETRQDFPAGWVEKAETGSIARALAVAGFGTQFAPELDEAQDGDVRRPADMPQGRGAYSAGRVGYERTGYEPAERDARAPQSTRTAVAPGEVWEGPGLCPRCHAPEGKRHGKPCVG